MPFRVLPNGTIECDTLQEAMAVQRAASGQPSGNGDDSTDEQDEVQEDAYDKFWGDVQDNGKRFMKILASKNGEAIATDELAVAFKVEAKDLQRTTIHVRKMGERYSLVPFKTKKKMSRGKFRTLYWMPKPVANVLREKLSHVSAE